jgi:ketosteroid isomerase-like protein
MKQKLIEMFEMVDRRLFDKLEMFYTDDVKYERPGYKTLSGVQEIINFYKVTRVIGGGSHTLEGVIEMDDLCCCWGRFSGTSRDGKLLDERFCDVYKFDQGRIAHRITHFFRPAV